MVVDSGDLSFRGIVLGGGLDKNVQCKVAGGEQRRNVSVVSC